MAFHTKKSPFLLGVLFFFLLCPSWLPSQTIASQQEKEFQSLQHEVTVTLKLIQVYVTDKKRKPVMNLNKSDFLLYDNGDLQTITDFERHMAAPAKKPSDLQPSRLPSKMNRKFILLFDIDNNNLIGIEKSKLAALHFLETQTRPTDEIAVLSYSFVQGLILHEYLTTDHQKVKSAILRIERFSGKYIRGFVSGNVGTTMGPSLSPESQSWEVKRSASLNIDQRMSVQTFTATISEFAKAMCHVPGYKNIIFFSQGISQTIFSDTSIRSHFKRMSRELAEANSPLYTINSETLDPFNPKGNQGEASLTFMAKLSGGKSYEEVGAVVNFESIAEDIQELTQNY